MTDRSLFQSLVAVGRSSCGVWPLRNWSCQHVYMWALDSTAGDRIYKVFTGPLSTVIGFEAWFPLCSAFPQNLQAWSIKECEIYSKSHCCLFLTVSRVVLSSLVWSCLLLRISSLFSCDSLPLFGTWCHQENQLFQSESLPLPSCSLVDCVESMKCCNTIEKRGMWRNEEWDHTAGIYRRGFISCHIVHSGCAWNQICYNNRNPSWKLESRIQILPSLSCGIWEFPHGEESQLIWASGETWQQVLAAPAGKMVALIGVMEKKYLKERSKGDNPWMPAVAEG